MSENDMLTSWETPMSRKYEVNSLSPTINCNGKNKRIVEAEPMHKIVFTAVPGFRPWRK